MEEKDLKKVLEEYLYALKLPTFVKHYQAFAQDAARSGQSYERFLLGLVLKTVYTRAGGELTDPQEGCKLKDIKIKTSGEQPCLGVRQ